MVEQLLGFVRAIVIDNWIVEFVIGFEMLDYWIIIWYEMYGF